MRRSRCCHAPIVAGLLALLLAALAHGAQSPWRGLALTEALARLGAQGLSIIYSSDLVGADMVVESEPQGASPHEVLEEILAPHGLAARLGPGGTLLVVAREERRLGVRLVAPVAGQVTVGPTRLEAVVDGETAVERVDFVVDGRVVASDREAPWEAVVPLLGGGSRWRLGAIAHGADGSRASDSLATRNWVVQDRLEVALQQVAVTLDRRQRAPLGAEDFTLLVDGVPTAIASFERGEAPLSVVLLVDASESMGRGALVSSLAGARAFVERLGSRDEAMALLFSDRVRAMTPFGGDTEALLAPLAEVAAGGGTALNDHLWAALALLEGRLGRPVVVLLSDGADVVSSFTAAEVGRRVAAAGATIYWLRPGHVGRGSFSSAWRDPDENLEQRRQLERVVLASGGRLLEAVGAERIAAAYAGILDELRDQVVLGFYPPHPERSRWSVEVRSRRPGVRLRYRDSVGGG